MLLKSCNFYPCLVTIRTIFDFRDNSLCNLASLSKDFFKYFEFGIILPSDVIQNSLIPKSIPTALSVFSNGLISTSVQQSDTKYFPLGSFDTVALSILPCGTNLFSFYHSKFRQLNIFITILNISIYTL